MNNLVPEKEEVVESIAENFLHLLENFASETSPLNPVEHGTIVVPLRRITTLILVAPTVAAAGLAITNGKTDAGKVTNQVGAVKPVYGRDPIVGIVSEMAFRKPHRVDMLVFYSLYRPAIGQLSNAIPAAAAPLAL